MMQPEWIRGVLTIVGGALAGGLTNSVAVWMLFHPYAPPSIGPFRLRFLHGAIPKNQPRLARAVGRTVGNRLLNEDDLRGIFGSDELKEAFEARLEGGIETLLSTEFGSLSELFPDVVREPGDGAGAGDATSGDRASGLLSLVADAGALWIAEWVRSDAFEAAIERELVSFLDGVRDRPIGDLLTPAREAAVTEFVERWLEDAVERDAFDRVIHDYLERGTETLLTPDRSLEGLLPQGLAASLERALATYLPVVVQRLGRLLEDPAARARVESGLREVFQRLIRDLRFHQRVVARLVVTEDALDRVLTAVQDEGAERLSEMLREPDVQRALAAGVNEAVADLLRRPVTEVLGSPTDANILRARETLAHWIRGMVRDPGTRAFVAGRLQSGLSRASERTWGDLTRHLPMERVSERVVTGLRGETGARVIRDALGSALSGLATRPLGRIGGWLPDDAARRMRVALAPGLWRWLQAQTPDLVRRMDVERRVEEKVLQFPTAELEAIVRRVTERELRLIVRLGYVLGALIGGILVGVQILVP
jgi:hypothetical protein